MSANAQAQQGARVIFIPPPLYYAIGLAGGIAINAVNALPLGGRPATAIAGAVLATLGLALTFAGVAAVIRHRTTIVPHHPVATLLTGGAYRLSRNPMYTGLAVERKTFPSGACCLIDRREEEKRADGRTRQKQAREGDARTERRREMLPYGRMTDRTAAAILPCEEHDTDSFRESVRNFRWDGAATACDRIDIASDAGAAVQVNTYTNEFWTSRQRAAHSLHEVSYRACFKPQLPRFFIERLTAAGRRRLRPVHGPWDDAASKRRCWAGARTAATSIR